MMWIFRLVLMGIGVTMVAVSLDWPWHLQIGVNFIGMALVVGDAE